VTGPASRTTRPASSRPHFTGRAAILAVVLCAIALSLAYPIREYIAQRRQIDQLQAQRQQLALHLKQLRQEQKRLHDPSYIEREARDRLHMCFPNQKCYVIIEPDPRKARSTTGRADGEPWYARLWKSVQQANQQTKPEQTKPEQTKPVQTKPVQTKPVQTKPMPARTQSEGASELDVTVQACMKVTSIARRGDGCAIHTGARLPRVAETLRR
jgi:cell division protein FtsL